MPRLFRLPWLLTAALLVTGCRPTDAPPITPPPITQPPITEPPVTEPPITVPPTVPGRLADQTVALGQALDAKVDVPFGGRWTIPDLPAWLSVSARAGQGALSFTLSARRAEATPLAADQPALDTTFTVDWTGPDGVVGKATVRVTADQYALTGRVVDAARLTGADVGGAAGLNVNPEPQSRGVIVKYRGQGFQGQKIGAAQNRATLERAGVLVQESRELGPRLSALKVSDVPAALAALRADPNVEYAVPNAVLRPQQATAKDSGSGLALPVTPSDAYAALQWPFRLLGYPAVWRDMEGGAYTRPVTVAVLDSGTRFDHPDLAGTMWGPGEGALDLLSDKNNGDGDGIDLDPTDPLTPERARNGRSSSHGTHVTGIIAARWGENAPSCAACSTTGVVGAVYRAPVKVLPVRIIDALGDAAEADVIEAVRYAAGLPVTLDGKVYTNPHPAQVVNLSLGGPISAADARPMCEVIAQVRARGVLVFAAAGNAGSSVPYYPAACSAAVAVGSVSLSGGSAPLHAGYSNAYPQVQLSAPGGSNPFPTTTFNGATLNGAPFPDMVFSTSWDYGKNQPNYYAASGTSQATPQVSALAALLLSKGVTTGAEDTLERLLNTATDLGAAGRDEQFGAGMINAAAALRAPAVSDTLGLRLQDARGRVFQPKLDALGRFQAWLGDGSYRLTAGRDRDGNGVYGEAHEPGVERAFALNPSVPRADLGDLTPR